MNNILAANFPVQPNKSQTLAGKSILLFLNYGPGATVENPKWGLVGGQRNSPLSMSGDEVDGSDKASGGWGENLQGTKTWSIEQEGVYKVNNEMLDALKYAFMEDIAVHIMRLDKYGNAVKGWANITEFSDDNPHDDVATVTMTLSGIGKPEFTTNEPDPRNIANAITDLAATSTAAGTVNLTFTAPAEATAAVLQQSADGITFTDTDVEITDSTTSATVNGLSANSKLSFRLKVNGGSHNGYSNIANVTVAGETE